MALLTSLLLGVAGRAVGDASGAPSHEVVVVDAGETLWSITRARLGPEADPRPLIEEIRTLNDLDGSGIVAGQRLRVPAA